jgi:hypothetical protein
VILLFVACGPGPIELGGVDAGGDSAGTSSPLPGDTDGGKDDDEEEEEEEPFGCSTLFAQERLPVYELTVEDGDWRHLEREWRTSDGTKDYVPITELKLDGEVVPDAMIRLKGNNGCCWVGDKMQFVISFNEVDPDARVEGQRKIALDAPYYEPTVLKNRLANWFLLRAGLAGDCTNNAELHVNGEYFGLYAHMEELNRDFLERNFGKDNDGGDLWKYGTVLDKHQDDEVDTTRIETFWSSYDPDNFMPLGDPDEWLREWAAEALLPDGDGYWCCGHNYYLYDHPERGFLWVPWDKDGTFDWVPYDLAPDAVYYPTSVPHMAAMLARDELHARYVEHVVELTELYGSDEMLAAYAEMRAQTEARGLAEPHRYYDNETYVLMLDSLANFVPARRSYLDAWVAANAP